MKMYQYSGSSKNAVVAELKCHWSFDNIDMIKSHAISYVFNPSFFPMSTCKLGKSPNRVS